jgi:hypothetical protein
MRTDGASEKRKNESIGDSSSRNKKRQRSNENADPPSPIVVDGTTITFPVDCKSYMMPIAGNRTARDLVKPHCTRLVQHAQTCNEFENPHSDVLDLHLTPSPVTNRAAIYYRSQEHADQNRTKTTKVGSTSKFRDRIALDKQKNKDEKVVLAHETYLRMMDFDNTSGRFNSFMEHQYKKVMETTMTNERLAAFQRRMAVAIHKDGGDKLGAKKEIMLQMLEYGYQLELETGAPAEFLMYDDEVLQR